MSDLQVALIALGALIIAGVVVYNWMQERKLRKNITEEFIVPQKDVLADDFYIDADAYVDKTLDDTPKKTKLKEKFKETPAKTEPVVNVAKAADAIAEAAVETPDFSINAAKKLPHTPAQTPAEEAPANEKAIPAAATMVHAQEAADLSSPLPPDLHPQIDLTALLFAPKKTSAKALNEMAEAIASDLGVPMMMHGMDESDKWQAISAKAGGETFKQIACSMQLADRAGPISKQKLNKFQFAIENLGLDLGAHVEWQGAGDAMQRAINLDKFCMEVDQLVSVHLLQGEAPVHGTKFRGLAEACGMQLGEDGKFYLYAPNSPDMPQFVLINQDNQPFTTESLRNSVIKGATFQLEIPKVISCDQVFSQMVQVAQKMSNSLGMRMVDDNQKPLGDLQIEKIRQQLKVIHATMLARGVMPGSPSSARLFN